MKKIKLKMVLLLVISFLAIFFIYKTFEKVNARIIIKDNSVELDYLYDGKEVVINGQKIKADEYIHFFVPKYFDLSKIEVNDSEFTVEE